MAPGRKIWVANHVMPDHPYFDGPYDVLWIKDVLPAGKTESGAERKRSLIQVYTDPGGLRTLAAADIWGRDPARAETPW